ncbi:Y-family DNA polymerase [Carnimonas bestiolae]|uniref:Y-family DNA polymerase n=1 Tax=Carnimonas bestiolae TaxID=3402172 RepID=UPI003EDC757F
MRPVIGLCDCNNFYVSCERVFAPSLEGQPVGVLSNNDGCIIARSQELKDLDIPMGQPAFQIPPSVRKKITLCSSNYALYGDMSRRVTETLRARCPAIETYSIDESFLFFDGFSLDDLDTHCQRMRYEVKRNTGIPVSIGLSTSRTLAKIANHRAKKDPACAGVCWLDPDSITMQELLEQLPVDEVWGVSRRLGDRLAAMGITTAWQLRQADPKHIRSRFSVVQEKLVWELRGHDCIETESLTKKQNIMTSRSFGRATDNRFDVKEAIRMHAQHGAEKLRKQGSEAQGILVFMKTNRHRMDQLQYNPSIVIPLVSPSNDPRTILAAATEGFDRIWKDGYRYAKAGVMMLDTVDTGSAPKDLFDDTDSQDKQRRQALLNTIDKLNAQMGRDTLSFGGKRETAPWHLRRQHLSKRFTTCWCELPLAHV